MSLDVCTVSGPVLRPDGSPCYPATVTITLSGRDRAGANTVLPAPLTVDTAADGIISVDLWPNMAGLAGAVYQVSVREKVSAYKTRAYQSWTISVPAQETANLAEISTLVPPATVDDVQAAVNDARGLRDQAAASAATAIAATLVGFAVAIYEAGGVKAGGYYAERSAARKSVQSRLFIEVLQGDADAEVDVYFEIDGAIAYGPITVAKGVPFEANELVLQVAAGQSVGFVVTRSAGATELFAKSYGALA